MHFIKMIYFRLFRFTALFLIVLGCLILIIERPGIILLAHGAPNITKCSTDRMARENCRQKPNEWNEEVLKLGRHLNWLVPTEIAFGMAKKESIQKSLKKLSGRVKRVIVVPLFISEHSPIIRKLKVLLPRLSNKLIDQKKLPKVSSLTQTLEGDILVSKILHDRVYLLRKKNTRNTVVIIAHGPNSEQDNKEQLKAMQSHVRYLGKKIPDIKVFAITHRNDAHELVKLQAKIEFRMLVQKNSYEGNVIVLPLLLSKGGIEKELLNDLEGLTFSMGHPLLPHSNINLWIWKKYLTSWMQSIFLATKRSVGQYHE